EEATSTIWARALGDQRPRTRITPTRATSTAAVTGILLEDLIQLPTPPNTIAPPNRTAAPITGTLKLRKPNVRRASTALATRAMSGNRRPDTLSTSRTDAASATTMSKLLVCIPQDYNVAPDCAAQCECPSSPKERHPCTVFI